ncbi:hypothetical protein BGZ65_005787, partial [Modicella reniformis]
MTTASGRSQRSATISNPPSAPPSGYPNQPVSTFTSGGQTPQPQHQQQHRHLGYAPTESFNSAQASPTSQLLHPRASVQGNVQQQQNTWSDKGWRSIFDAALAKAQQAVQLDGLGETKLAANLYAQAANDLGRVIPLCGSEKKKQSMLAIQSIYLDRVGQLKAGASGKKTNPTTSETRYSFANGKGVPYGKEDEYISADVYQKQDPHDKQQQSKYQPPPPPLQHPQKPFQSRSIDEMGKGLKPSRKKRSKTQPSAPQPPEFLQEVYSEMQISPPHTAPTSSPSPQSVAASPNNTFPAPLLTPGPQSADHHQQQQEPPASISLITSKPSRWRPFGKKKSKSFSGETAPSILFQPPSNYELPIVPSIPTGAQQLVYPPNNSNIVDPADRGNVYPQPHGWCMNHGDDPSPLEDLVHHTQYYKDDDADLYYIADTKGRARAFEGK